MLCMGVNYAIREKKSAPLCTDFTREFLTRHFGQQAADAIYEAAPKYKRGPNKGAPKGWAVWTKCTKGGWVRTGSYDHVEAFPPMPTAKRTNSGLPAASAPCCR